MLGRTDQGDQWSAVEAEAESVLREMHRGGFLWDLSVVWRGVHTDVNHVTDEAAARAGELVMGAHPEAAALMADLAAEFANETYHDLRSSMLAGR